MKTCKRCKVEKPKTEFNKNKNFKDGHAKYCRECTVELNAQNRQKRKADPEKNSKYLLGQQDYHLRRTFGISLDEYNAMHASQGGVCCICQQPQSNGRKLAVDHCHSKGHIRGLLCDLCNTALGKFNDDAHRLERAARYIRATNTGRLQSLSDIDLV